MSELGISAGQIAIIAATALLAGLIRGFSGFGSALVIAPVLSLLVGPRVAVPAIVLTHIVTTVQLFPSAMRDVYWPRVVPLSIAGCLGVPVGAYLLVIVDQEAMRRAISVAIILFSLIMLAGWRYSGTASRSATVAAGGIGGVLSGAASIGGPPVILFLLAGSDRAAVNRATFIFYFLFTQLVGMAMYWFTDMVDQRTLLLVLVLTPTLVFGMWVGERLFDKSSEQLFRRVALAFLLAVGIATLAL